ncbi:MAG: hypothetical protein KGJ60_15545 [Verrucomicrobiota bacterium]|nr:hypothetical protein [Verrucomicrobiota bacterium]
MKVWARQFNLYLALAAALLCGCQTDRKDQPAAALRVHIETSPDSAATTQTVSVLRSDPVLVTLGRDPVLTEANVVAARIIDTPGGFALEVRFDENGAWLLEQYTAANPGRHLAVFGQWGGKPVTSRWLAAPLITRRIADGVLTFTPDMSRDEADQLVAGLNNVAWKNRKKGGLR